MNALPDRMVEKVRTDGSCWTWLGAVTENGYGQMWFDGKPRRPHRVAYLLLVGEIPDGLTIDHLCRNKLCVNPAHMEPVTSAENKRRWARLITACKRGHDYTQENTGRNSRGQRHCKRCIRESRQRAREMAGQR